MTKVRVKHSARVSELDCLARRGWQREELAALRRHACLLDLPVDTDIAEATDHVRPFVLVLEGQLSVAGRDGVRIVEAGGCWGADALLGAPLAKEMVQTLAPTRLVVVGPREFMTLVRVVPALAHLVARDLARRVPPSKAS